MEATMALKEKLDDLNSMILKGEILESMDKYYHPDCVVIEKNDVVRQVSKTPKTGSRMFLKALKRGSNQRSNPPQWGMTSR